MIEFFVPGTPQAQGNHRVSRSGRLYESNRALASWREAVKLVATTARRGRSFDEPVAVAVEFRMPKPKRPRFLLPAVAPDLDKLCRAIGDALESSGLIANDSRIVEWSAVKLYAEPGYPPGAFIRIRPVTN